MSPLQEAAGPMTQRTVVVQLFRGPLAVMHLTPGAPSPTQERLDEIAAEYTPTANGARPTVRVLEAMTIRAAS